MKTANKIDKVKWALYRAVTPTKPAKLANAKWIVYGAMGISSMMLFGADPTYPKWPRSLGD